MIEVFKQVAVGHDGEFTNFMTGSMNIDRKCIFRIGVCSRPPYGAFFAYRNKKKALRELGKGDVVLRCIANLYNDMITTVLKGAETFGTPLGPTVVRKQVIDEMFRSIWDRSDDMSSECKAVLMYVESVPDDWVLCSEIFPIEVIRRV